VPYRRKKLAFAISSPDEFLYYIYPSNSCTICEQNNCIGAVT